MDVKARFGGREKKVQGHLGSFEGRNAIPCPFLKKEVKKVK